MNYRIKRLVKRGEQSEVWYDLLDDNEDIISQGHVAVVKPSIANDHAALTSHMTEKVIPAHEKNKTHIKTNYTRFEVEDLLKEKGFLLEDETLDNLKTRADMLKSKGDII